MERQRNENKYYALFETCGGYDALETLQNHPNVGIYANVVDII